MNSFGTFRWVSVWIILWYKDSGREGRSRVAKLKLILSDLCFRVGGLRVLKTWGYFKMKRFLEF